MNHNSVVASLLLAASSSPALAGTLTVNVANDPAGAGTCPTACSLRQAIATAVSGDTLVFDPSLASPITLGQGALLINKALTIQGPGAANLTVSANNASQILVVSAQVSISGLTLADGFMIGATGSNGGVGAPGTTGSAGGTGGNGGPGSTAGGACVQVASAGVLVLDQVAVLHCVAYGGSAGNGGNGGSGDQNPSGPYFAGGAGGNGGAGGAATGGAILVYGSLSLLNSSVVAGQAYGGAGGAGAIGGVSLPSSGASFAASGVSGAGGAASGGAVFAAASASLRITNSTIASNSATGGTGGAGITSGTPFVSLGGTGGVASGGLIRVDTSAALADLEFSTLTGGVVVVGSGGSGAGSGSPGTSYGNAISAGNTITVLSSVIVDVQSGVSLCDGQVVAASGSVNLSEDTSCSGFTLQGTFAQLFQPLDLNTTPWPGYMPLYKSTVIDAAATCLDLASQTVTSDQHGTVRPQGPACDLGAIEADYIFVDGFE